MAGKSLLLATSWMVGLPLWGSGELSRLRSGRVARRKLLTSASVGEVARLRCSRLRCGMPGICWWMSAGFSWI